MKNRILFFSPSADLWEHTFPEALVAEMLVKRGHDVAMLRCRGIFRPLCPAAQSAGYDTTTPADIQHRQCARCNAKGRLVDRKLGLRHIEIDDYVQPQDESLVNDVVRHAEALRGQMQCADDFDQISLHGLSVGRVALYDLILRHKKSDFDFSDSTWSEYLTFLRLASWSSLLSERLLEGERPDRVSVYNSLYVPHRAFCLRARSRAVDQYFMHAGTNLSRQHGTLMIGRDFTWHYLRGLVARYEGYADQAASAAAIEDVTRHFLCLLSAQNIFVYSAARSQQYFDVRSHFGIGQDQKFIVASTSSYDERFAVETVGAGPAPDALLFPRILDWVAHLIELAETRPDWFLLIRVHPREFPNRRDNVQSAHSRALAALLNDLPPNIKVNWPDDNLSVYDLAQEADLFLNAWSSVGKEVALLGLPVVVYSPDILLYPASLNAVGATKEQYLAAIERSLDRGWSLDQCRQAYRWFALEFSRSCVDLRSSFAPSNRYRQRRPIRILLRVLQRLFGPVQERWDIARRRSMPVAEELVNRLFTYGLDSSERAQKQAPFNGTSEEESAAVFASLGQLGRHLFAANPAERPSKLQRAFIAAGILRGNGKER